MQYVYKTCIYAEICVLRPIESIIIVNQHLLLEFHRNPAHEMHDVMQSNTLARVTVSLQLQSKNLTMKLHSHGLLFRLSLPETEP